MFCLVSKNRCPANYDHILLAQIKFALWDFCEVSLWGHKTREREFQKHVLCEARTWAFAEYFQTSLWGNCGTTLHTGYVTLTFMTYSNSTVDVACNGDEWWPRKGRPVCKDWVMIPILRMMVLIFPDFQALTDKICSICFANDAIVRLSYINIRRMLRIK